MTNRSAPRDRGTTDLRAIAREAMLARGMLPDFSADAMRELAAINAPATHVSANTDPDIRDRKSTV